MVVDQSILVTVTLKAEVKFFWRIFIITLIWYDLE